MNHSIFKLAPLFIFCFFLAISCSDNGMIVDPPGDQKLEGTYEDLKVGLSSFSVDVFKDLVTNEEGNLLVSPLSLEIALYMTCNGAKNNTLEQMLATLGISNMNIAGLNHAYKELKIDLLDNSSRELNISNSIWWDPRLSINEDFKSSMESNFDAESFNKEFNDQTKDEINDWAKEKTEGRIEKVLESIDPEEVMFIINALYFVADWDKGFPSEATFDRMFFLENGQSFEVPFMFSDDQRKFVENGEYSAVELPFVDENYSMSFVMPKDDISINEFILNSDLPKLMQDIADIESARRLLLTMPKFKIENKFSMKASLTRLGIVDAFNKANADLSNLGTADGNLFITKVLHDTYLKIDEKGAEGAAVTTVGIGTTSLPPSIELNRSFLFYIRHIDTGAIVFIGKMEDPR